MNRPAPPAPSIRRLPFIDSLRGFALLGVFGANLLIFSGYAFRFGPAEWLWRTLTYWRVQPLRAA